MNNIDLNQAIQIIKLLKGNNLNEELKTIKNRILEKELIDNIEEIWEAANTIKSASLQIDEIIHAFGIIKCFPKILKPNEHILDCSLGAGAEGLKFDLVTNYRVAEFKFSRWNETNANGARKREILKDYVKLWLYDTQLRKELYTLNYKNVTKYFSSKKACWQNVLSKQPTLKKEFETFLLNKNIQCTYIYDIYKNGNIEIIDLEKIL